MTTDEQQTPAANLNLVDVSNRKTISYLERTKEVRATGAELLQPVPIPMRRLWREIRIRVLPVVVFIVGVIVVIFLWRAAR